MGTERTLIDWIFEYPYLTFFMVFFVSLFFGGGVRFTEINEKRRD